MMAQIEDEELPDSEKYIQSRNGVDFIPSSMILSAVDAKLRLEMGAEKMLSGILEPLRDRYDAIIIDTAPTLGALNINALAAADEVIITVNPQLLAMMGLQDFLKTVKKIKARVNERLLVAGILLTMYDARTNLCKVITEQVRDTFVSDTAGDSSISSISHISRAGSGSSRRKIRCFVGIKFGNKFGNFETKFGNFSKSRNEGGA